MTNRTRLLAAAAIGLMLGRADAMAADACSALPRPAVLPAEAVAAPREEANWRDSLAALARLPPARYGEAQIAFLGDSLVQSWAPPIFANFYGTRQALNLGVSGDFTQALLWRLEHLPAGALLRPALFLLLIGTNNIGNGSTAADVALGIAEVVRLLRLMAPESRVLLVGILPRGATADEQMRRVQAQVNAMIATCADDANVFYTNPGSMLVDGNGALMADISYDQLHLTWLGYAILSAGLEAAIQQALGRMKQP